MSLSRRFFVARVSQPAVSPTSSRQPPRRIPHLVGVPRLRGSQLFLINTSL